MDAPLAHCRGLGPAAFAITRESGHPLVETCIALLSDPELDYERSPLARFHAAFQPRNAAEIMGLPSSHAGLQGAPETWRFPWMSASARNVQKRKRLSPKHREKGAGFAYFGPTSPEKGRSDLARLKAVVAAISADGFRLLPGVDGLVRAEILSSGAEWRARVQVGQHRTAALAALGGTAVPIWPQPVVVRREEAADWPAVRDGVVTREEALDIFDRMFEAVQPAALDRAKLSPPAAAASAA
ncbi:hypothetical protein [Amaricoccus sp.]|uniref:hypothetical protein n=1 Tax=Amaricoccus sp. TaxID=1872485 RepID=UPI001B62A296|nr:hypothetical protein [Amaricoccus sp.]MBP7001009.1 hypothetical protein [Amaricoccus sp.]